MAATQVNIVNIALRLIGVKRITSMSESVESVRVMNDLWEFCRDEVLAEHPWNFAIKYSATLSQNATDPTHTWDYSYALPPDCIGVIHLENPSHKFEVVDGNLFTDTQDPKIKYIFQVTTTGDFSKSFVTAFAAKLAVESCYALTKSKTLQKQKQDEYEKKLAKAKTTDGQEGTTDKIEDSSWIDDRE